MKTLIAAIVSIVLGCLFGGSGAFLSCNDPGPDFKWMYRPQPVGGADAGADSQHESIDVVNGEEFDFGIMDRGETRSRVFKIQNNTTQPMQLAVASTTCKCTVGELSQSEIPPGGEGEINLEWIAKSLDTEFRHGATISTGNDVRPDIMLSVFGRVIQMVSVAPRTVAFSDVTVHDSRTGEFVIYSFKEDDLEIEEYHWVDGDTADFFELDWSKATPEVVAEQQDAKSAVLCKLKMKSGLPLGSVFQTLELKTSASDAGMVDVPIMAHIVGDVTMSGEKYRQRASLLKFGPLKQGLGASTKVFLTVKGDHAKDFAVTGVEVDPPSALAVDLGEPRSLKNGKVVMCPIEVKVLQDAPVVNYSGGEEHPTGKVVISTNHPDSEEFAFEVVFAVVD